MSEKWERFFQEPRFEHRKCHNQRKQSAQWNVRGIVKFDSHAKQRK